MLCAARLPKWFGERPGKKSGDPETPQEEEKEEDLEPPQEMEPEPLVSPLTGTVAHTQHVPTDYPDNNSTLRNPLCQHVLISNLLYNSMDLSPTT